MTPFGFYCCIWGFGKIIQTLYITHTRTHTLLRHRFLSHTSEKVNLKGNSVQHWFLYYTTSKARGSVSSIFTNHTFTLHLGVFLGIFKRTIYVCISPNPAEMWCFQCSAILNWSGRFSSSSSSTGALGLPGSQSDFCFECRSDSRQTRNSKGNE